MSGDTQVNMCNVCTNKNEEGVMKLTGEPLRCHLYLLYSSLITKIKESLPEILCLCKNLCMSAEVLLFFYISEILICLKNPVLKPLTIHTHIYIIYTLYNVFCWCTDQYLFFSVKAPLLRFSLEPNTRLTITFVCFFCPLDCLETLKINCLFCCHYLKHTQLPERLWMEVLCLISECNAVFPFKWCSM